MKRVPVIAILLAALVATSCSKKAPSFVNTIPDNAFMVASMHPQQILEKSQISSFESIKEKITDKFLLDLVENPVKSGLMLNEYSFIFVYFIEESPMVGFISGVANEDNFKGVVEKIIEKEGGEIASSNGINIYNPAGEAAIAWNGKKVLMLGSPQKELSSGEMMAEVTRLFNLEKENAITSMVNFNDFIGKMKDLNFWVSSDEVKKMMDMMSEIKDFQFDLPIDMYNNYGQFFFEFEDGAMYMHSETMYNEEIAKNVEQFMVLEPKINDDMLEMTPGGDLLLAMAVSLDLQKFQDLMENVDLSQLNGVGGKIEEATGVPSNEIWEALSGDLVIAINGAEEGGMIPVEALIGIGMNNEELQKKLMGTVGGMVPVEDEGDFFMINANGLEIYSGIINDIWVITNAKGYKDAISGNGLKSSLKDSKFMDYAGGGMGMYLNLDMTTYPSALQSMLSQDSEATEMFELMTESLVSLGVQATQNEGDATILTAKKNENSLYTMMKLAEKMDK